MGLLTIISCKYIRQADSTATFRIKHGQKWCSGKMVVQIPVDWIEDSHNFRLEKVDLTAVPQVIEKGTLDSIFSNLKSYLVPCSCETKIGRPKKNKRGPKPAPKPVEEPVEEPVQEPEEGPFEGSPDKAFTLEFGDIILEESDEQKERLDWMICLDSNEGGINWRIPCKSKNFLFFSILIFFSSFQILSNGMAYSRLSRF